MIKQTTMCNAKTPNEQAAEFYYGKVQERIGEFQKAKEYLSHVLEQLFEEKKVRRGVILLSRIKSLDSVIENWRLGKNLHDIYGITLLTQKQDEIEAIRKRLEEENEYNICSKKAMNQKRGYEAIHFLFDVDNTKVECHMQTHDDYKNVYPHSYYKVRRSLDRDLTHEEEGIIKKSIQNRFENGKLGGTEVYGNIKTNLPQMWVATFNNEGKMEEMELDEFQRLLIMYPQLDASKNKKKVSNLKEPDQDDIER